MKLPTVSIVIPAYNEEAHLRACLDAIAEQTVAPLEVIVVDNNSTDATARIARSYPFVTVINEPRQGVVYARDCGFDAARGEVIGRIDSDSIIATNWVETVQRIFADDSIEATSGQIFYRHIGLAEFASAVDKRVRAYMTRKMGALGEQFLYGSNMAIRRSVWQRVRDRVCHLSYLHEDNDLAAHLAGPNSGVIFSPELYASVDWRQAAAGPRQFLHHVWSSDPVFKHHNLKSRPYATRVALLVSLLYIPIHLLYKGYDPVAQRYSIAYLFTKGAVRTSPVSASTNTLQ